MVSIGMFEDNSAAPRSSFANKGEDIGASIRLDPALPTDEPLLYATFASTRTGEMALTGWNAEQQESFLRQQYEAQRRSYLMQLPEAEYFVIRCGESGMGRLIVDRREQTIHIVDIAVLPEFRGRGIGSTLMAALIKEAAESAKAVTLHVERFNPALGWYERLGFTVMNTGPIYLEMIWRPAHEKSNVNADHDVTAAGDAHADSNVEERRFRTA
jgi:ribosomal protein S18 acetylase RimI-like enzyme